MCTVGNHCPYHAEQALARANAKLSQQFPDAPPVNLLLAARSQFADIPQSAVDDQARQIELHETKASELNLAPGDSQLISSAEWGDDVIDELEFTHTDENPTGPLQVRAAVGVDWGRVVPAGEDPDEWLNEHQDELDAFVQDTYGGHLGDGAGWEDTPVDFYTPVRPDDTVGSAGSRACAKATDLHNAVNGAYGVTSFATAARRWFDQRDSDVQEAADSYGAAAVWTGTAENSDGESISLDEDYTDEDLSEDAKASARADVAQFTLEHRDLIKQAQHIAAQQGRSFDMSDIGHNFLLSRNGNNTGFSGRDLGPVGDQLHEAAQTYGSFDLYPGDDGLLYAL